MGWLILLAVVVVIAVPAGMLLRRSRAGITGTGAPEHGAPPDAERHLQQRWRDGWGSGSGG